ncbi:GTPase HflX [Lysinibacillus fusiformis]|uniref:GTPase HflX n=1 Tax=Lysinibacillus fusiformis TaxID=28031 RepID=A0A1H9EWZ3_9BACI|nr:GTPase HflX [Lysinibacillus fusiformis]HAU32816.1 GTPase HflX [Lysinibacillus sp.]SCX50303.1 GTP-binding protein HflX [Lysinibacillus fusiformis]SCY25355.1 GTP-binding protein HflX [Lysinibacillus fusiformis]SDB24270.1 GTP-binding protein HflX [Lysinibacillus fusiformis]SEN38219.1 GTP-binding protein HflX [Lysinibacillus fusiformis]
MDRIKEVDVLIEKAILVGVNLRNDAHFEYSMEELRNLTEALNVEVVGVVTQNLERVTPSHYVGTGKIEEIKNFYEEAQANLVIFNDELSPSQIRNLERDLATKVIDRTMLILDIFGRRAKTREAQMQVELAQLQYMLPRLVGLHASLSRQGGGTGGGFKNRGAGETKLELDRRKIEDQIAKIKKDLEQVKDQRETQRKQRRKNALPVVSIVGYTNAGKSTIMNQLLAEIGQEEHKQVFEKDMLFATLETSVRQIELPDKKTFLLTDTVGFVSKLPHHLVKAFRSTLEEARDADLLLHVVDVSNSEHGFMMDVTNETLKAVGVEGIPTIYVYNKADLAQVPYPVVSGDNIWVSAKQGVGLEELIQLVRQHIFSDYVTCEMLIPYDQGNIVSYLNEHASVSNTAYEEGGTLLSLEVKEADYAKYQQYVVN